MKVFQVEVSFSMYVVAEDEATALEVAEEHAGEELSNNCNDYDVREVKHAADVSPRSDLDALPWLQDGISRRDYTVSEWLEIK